jgi:hypothetical protein
LLRHQAQLDTIRRLGFTNAAIAAGSRKNPPDPATAAIIQIIWPF